jgi:hypothetical protein
MMMPASRDELRGRGVADNLAGSSVPGSAPQLPTNTVGKDATVLQAQVLFPGHDTHCSKVMRLNDKQAQERSRPDDGLHAVLKLAPSSSAAFRVFGGGHRATVGRGAAARSSTAGSAAREPDRPEAGGCLPYRWRWRGWPEGTSPHIPPEASRGWLVIEPLCRHPSCYRCGPCPVRLPYGQ